MKVLHYFSSTLKEFIISCDASLNIAFMLLIMLACTIIQRS